MASDVDIANLALAHLGDTATVNSLSPTDGSAQSAYCAMFYGPALNAIQEEHYWNFCTRRSTLASVTNPTSTWQYAYAAPSGAINIIAILDPNASNDYSASLQSTMPYPSVNLAQVGGVYTPQPFDMEANPTDGSDMILTNQANAVCRYTVGVTDTTKFSPLFILAFSHLLASAVAGPLLKGDAGRKAAQEQLQLYQVYLNKARDSDSSQRVVKPQQQVQWMSVR